MIDPPPHLLTSTGQRKHLPAPTPSEILLIFKYTYDIFGVVQQYHCDIRRTVVTQLENAAKALDRPIGYWECRCGCVLERSLRKTKDFEGCRP